VHRFSPYSFVLHIINSFEKELNKPRKLSRMKYYTRILLLIFLVGVSGTSMAVGSYFGLGTYIKLNDKWAFTPEFKPLSPRGANGIEKLFEDTIGSVGHGFGEVFKENSTGISSTNSTFQFFLSLAFLNVEASTPN
jgi:hypothetical protein